MSARGQIGQRHAPGGVFWYTEAHAAGGRARDRQSNVASRVLSNYGTFCTKIDVAEPRATSTLRGALQAARAGGGVRRVARCRSTRLEQ